MLEPIAKDWEVAPAASDALIRSWRYSRASAYSLQNTSKHTVLISSHTNVKELQLFYQKKIYFLMYLNLCYCD